MSVAMDLTANLGEFVVRAQWTDVPVAIRAEAVRALMNYFAVALAGCRDPAVEISAAAFRRSAASGPATLIGRGERTSLLHAASLNAMSANVFDFDDTHMPTIIHPTAPVAPALFALAQERRVSGEELLLALVIGVEVACRIGEAISPAHYNRGWHITSTCGIFGAAAASGRLLKLSPGQIVHALGIASAQSSGLVETLGTMAKSIGVGNSCANGLLSAQLAELGMQGPSRPLDGALGFLKVAAPSHDATRIADGLGERWALASVAYKPYPCGVVLNPVIDACLALRPQLPAAVRIKAIELRGHPLLRQRTDRPRPATGKLSQVSAQHAVAVSLLRGSARLANFSDAAVSEPAHLELGDRLRFTDDPTMAVDSATVLLWFDDGRLLVKEVNRSRGSLAAPLSDDDLEAKLVELAGFGRSGVDARRLADAVRSLPAHTDAGSIMDVAAGMRREK